MDLDVTVDHVKEKYNLVDYLHTLSGKLNNRFPNLFIESFDYVQFPFKVDDSKCDSFALEMADLQADNEAKINFEVLDDIAKFWISLPNKHTVVKNKVVRMIVQFGTAYVCEVTISSMVYNCT